MTEQQRDKLSAELTGEGEPAAAPPGADEAATGEWQRSKSRAAPRRNSDFGHRNRGEADKQFL